MDLTALGMPLESLSTLFWYVVPFLAVIMIIVFVHELGHFLVARYFGVAIEAFSIGFGREVVGWTDRHGTRWKIAWLPLGGYVKFKGDANAASAPDPQAVADPDNFYAKPLYQRALVVAAGPFANFALAIAIFAASFMFIGTPVGGPVAIDTVQEGSPAAEAGFRPGDVIVRIDDKEIASFDDLRAIVATSAGRELTFTIKRDGRTLRLKATPRERVMPDGLGGKARIGVLGVTHRPKAPLKYERKGPVEALALGTQRTWDIVRMTMSYVGGMITGRQSADQLSGPIRIAHVTGKVASVSLSGLVLLAALLSISIGLINLFPIPMLDGGHLLFYAIEAVRGRPLSLKAQEIGFRIGMAMVLMLMLFAVFNDVRYLLS